MLTESFVAAIVRPETVQSHVQHKDAGIYFHELQPLPAIRSILKKSSTAANCIAANRTHVFAAQVDKAVVQVYNIERGSQECLVPFPEKISSLALIGGRRSNSVLALGSEGGKLTLWEVGTGRQVSSAAAHLQAISCLAVDPTGNFLLSGSGDTNIHVWQTLDFLSFAEAEDRSADHSSTAPCQVLPDHRDAITALIFGHSFHAANIAVSCSKDKSCIVWDYRAGVSLHTFLLTSTPLCVALDPADRAFYVGLADGSIQLVDFYRRPTAEHPIHSSHSSGSVVEPPRSDRWAGPLSEDASEVLSLAVSYDGTKVVAGLQDGHVHVWDVGTGKIIGENVAVLLGPVTNLLMLPPTGLRQHTHEPTSLVSVVKPRQDGSFNAPDHGGTSLPLQYILQASFKQHLPPVSFSHALKHSEKLCGVSDPLMDDFSSAVFNIALTQDEMDADIASLDDPSTGQGGNPYTRLSAQGGPEMENAEAHALVAHTMQESLALRARNDELERELVRMHQADRERQRARRMKRSRAARTHESARQRYLDQQSGKGVPSDHAIPLAGPDSSADSDDLSIGG